MDFISQEKKINKLLQDNENLKNEIFQKNSLISSHELEILDLKQKNERYLRKIQQYESKFESFKISNYSKKTNMIMNKIFSNNEFGPSPNISPLLENKEEKSEFILEEYKNDEKEREKCKIFEMPETHLTNMNNSSPIISNNISTQKNEIENNVHRSKSNSNQMSFLRKKSNDEIEIPKQIPFQPSEIKPYERQSIKEAKLFQNFLIISCQKNKIESNPYKSFTSEPNILYNLSNNLDPQLLKTILECCFPLGVNCEKIKLTDSLSQINQIMLANHNLIDQRDNFFVLVIKTQESFEKGLNRTSDLLNVSNPNNLLYCICYKTWDFVYFPNGKVGFTTKKKDGSCYKVEKIFCFLTYFPFIKLFNELIIAILSFLKINKLKYCQESNADFCQIFPSLDNDFLLYYTKKQLDDLLKRIIKTKNPEFSSMIQIEDSELLSSLKYNILDINMCCYLEMEWISALPLSIIDPQNFIFLFMNIMLETPMVFICKSLGMLTSTILTFIGLLKPFKWPFPIILNLPNTFAEILNSPMPFLIGINKDKEFVIKNSKNHENAIFVNLDGKIEIFNKELTSTHILGDMYYNLVEKLKPLFKKLVKKNVNPNDSDKENIFKIFETIQTNTYNSIIELIPTKPPLKKDENSQKTVINYPSVVKKIKKKCQHNIFLEKFIQTQMFNLYLDEFYYHKGFDI